MLHTVPTLDCLENLRGRNHLKKLDINRRIILKCILGAIGLEGVVGIHLAKDRES